MYRSLKEEVKTEHLEQFADHVGDTRVDSAVSPPQSWSIFMKLVRTNKDIEGWQHGLNSRAGGCHDLPLTGKFATQRGTPDSTSHEIPVI